MRDAGLGAHEEDYWQIFDKLILTKLLTPLKPTCIGLAARLKARLTPELLSEEISETDTDQRCKLVCLIQLLPACHTVVMQATMFLPASFGIKEPRRGDLYTARMRVTDLAGP
jgi:hypothetical protein